MNKKGKFCLILLLLVFLSGCKKGDNIPVITIDSFWDNSLINGSIDKNQRVYQEYQGWELGLSQITEFKIKENKYSQGATNEENQQNIQAAVDKDKPVFILGCSNNKASRQAASVTNFMEIPMLIPFANGIYLRGDENTFTYRITPSTSTVSNYLFSQVFTSDLKQRLDNILFPDKVVKDYDVHMGVLFEDSSFSENSAIILTEAAMKAGLNISYYERVPSEKLQTEVQTLLKSIQDRDNKDIDLLFIIFEDSNLTLTPEIWRTSQNADFKKPLVFLVGNLNPSSYISDNPALDNDFMTINQDIDYSTCDPSITNSNSGFGYAAAKIAEKAIAKAIRSVPQKTWLQKLLHTGISADDENENMRGYISNELANFHDTVPCIGDTSFSNTKTMNNLEKNIVITLNSSKQNVSKDELIQKLAESIAYEMSHPNE